MKQTKVANIPIYTFDVFEKYPDLTAICTTRIGGVSENNYDSLNLAFHVGDNYESVIQNREIMARLLGKKLNRFTFGQQTHSDNIEIVEINNRGRGATAWNDGFPDTDALVTNLSNAPLAVLTADCAPIFLFDPEHRVIGISHSGKVGTEKEIVIRTIQKMQDTFNTCPEKIVAAIGPCIHKCCYEVDLPQIIKKQLIDSGLKEENIEVASICTSCNNDLFFSYRAAQGKTGRFMCAIILK